MKAGGCRHFQGKVVLANVDEDIVGSVGVVFDEDDFGIELVEEVDRVDAVDNVKADDVSFGELGSILFPFSEFRVMVGEGRRIVKRLSYEATDGAFFIGDPLFGPGGASAIDLDAGKAFEDDIVFDGVIAATADGDSTNGVSQDVSLHGGTGSEVIEVDGDNVGMAW